MSKETEDRFIFKIPSKETMKVLEKMHNPMQKYEDKINKFRIEAKNNFYKKYLALGKLPIGEIKETIEFINQIEFVNQLNDNLAVKITLNSADETIDIKLSEEAIISVEEAGYTIEDLVYCEDTKMYHDPEEDGIFHCDCCKKYFTDYVISGESRNYGCCQDCLDND